MNSLPQNDRTLPVVKSEASFLSRFVGYLWPLPARVELLGLPTGDLLLVPDQNSLVSSLHERPVDTRVLVLPCGGMSARAAAAFQTISSAEAIQKIEEDLPAPGTNLFVPAALAASWDWEEGAPIGGRKVRLIPDGGEKIARGHVLSPGRMAVKSGKMGLAARLFYGFGFWLGQALIFALPLALFGWLSLALGLGFLLLGTAALALFWNLLPPPGWFKGVVAGLALAGAGALLVHFLLTPGAEMVLRLSAGILLFCAWMGVVLQGVRKS